MSEAQLKLAVVRALRLVPHCHVLRQNAGKMFLKGPAGAKRVIDVGEAGTPDLQVLLPNGRSLWVELKAPKGSLTLSQTTWHILARQLGHEIVVARDVQSVVDLVRARIRNATATPAT